MIFRDFFRKNEKIFSNDCKAELSSLIYDEIIKRDVYFEYDEVSLGEKQPQFSYFIVKKDNKYAIAKNQMEFVTGYDYDRINVFCEGDSFNVLLLERDQESKFFLVEENCDFKKLIKADCRFIELISSSDFDNELYKFSIETINEYYRKFWLDNMSLDEDEACSVANIIRPIKNSLTKIAETKYTEYKKMQNKTTLLPKEEPAADNKE